MNRSPDLNFLLSAGEASGDTYGLHGRETGSHQELLAQRGIYWRLYQLQYKDQELGVGLPQVGADD